MPFIYIDRRKAGKGKSAANRQKLLAKIRSHIKKATPQNVGKGGVAQVYSSGRAANNPVKVANSALEEPWFAYNQDGDSLIVIPGNTEFDRGDEINIKQDEDSSPGAGPGDQGEDDFIVNIASNEFLELFFEDCELPNLDDEKSTDKAEVKMTPAGFARSGNAAQLSVIRTYKQMMGRRRALTAPHRREREELEERMKHIYTVLSEDNLEEEVVKELNAELNAIEQRIGELNVKIAASSGFDKVDLRYRKKEPQPLKQVDAVLVMVMDISGSMGQEEKTIARRWFALLYAFIKRRYSTTDLVFIAHTDEAFEMSEEDFFSTRVNGGTSVSPAIAKVNSIIKTRYDHNHTNIYVSHASDGDNWESDSTGVNDEMSKLMGKIQYFSYVEVGPPTVWRAKTTTSLWESYMSVHSSYPSKMSLSLLENPDDCYPVFKNVFKKK